MESEQPKSSGVKPTEILGLAFTASTFFVNAFKDTTQYPWMKQVALPAFIIAVCFLAYLAWKRLFGPWRRKRAVLRDAREKIAGLADFVRRFKQDVIGVNHTTSIAYQVSQIRLNPVTPGEAKPDAHTQAYYIQQVMDQLLERLDTPVNGLADIRLIFSIFDDFIRYVHDLYRDQWRKYLMEKRDRIDDHQWTQCVKARETYSKFVDDYRVFRKSKEKDSYAIGSSYNYENPDPLG